MHAARRTLTIAPLLFLALAAGATLDERSARAGDDAKKPEPKEAVKPTVDGPKTDTGTPAAPSTPASAGKLTITLADGKSATCREQAAQSFLVRGNWFPKTTDADKVKEGRKLLEDAIKYRTTQYGYFEGFGNPKGNPHPPKHYAKATTFMGMSATVHEKIVPALKCVEAALKAGPAANEYKPRAMGGMRFHNTYKGVEVSNHVYGIAVDIEPDRNTCCGCVAPWNEHPLCKQKDKTVWQRMVMPKSWVDTFEKYGFYWLGHDVLQDTMHFEFLGEPDKVFDAATTNIAQQ